MVSWYIKKRERERGKEETGDQVYIKRRRKRSDLEINELGRGEHDGGMEEKISIESNARESEKGWNDVRGGRQ